MFSNRIEGKYTSASAVLCLTFRLPPGRFFCRKSQSLLAVIHYASQGLPRVVNHLCRQALYEITGTQRQVVEEGNKRDCKK